MYKSTIYTNYAKWSYNALSSLAGSTIIALTDNPLMSQSRLSFEEYEALVRDFQEKNEIAQHGSSRLQKEVRNNARIPLLAAMKNIASSINLFANGNRELLASSGFQLVKERQTTSIPDTPMDLRIKDGRVSGEIQVLFSAVKHAMYYELQVTSAVDERNTVLWTDSIRSSSSRENFVGNLTPASRCYVRIRAHNRHGDSDWSQICSFIVR